MTSQKDIQSLIADIDSILPKPGSRLPWSKASDVTTQRQVLDRVRSYLVSQQQNFLAAPEKSPTPATPGQSEVVQQIVQAVTQEMDVLRADLMQPLQADLEDLRQQRESLVKEIQQLERTRQQIDSITQQKTTQQQIISEFSQGLISRCTESLTQQLAEVIANLEVQLLGTESTLGTIAPMASNRNRVGRVMQPQERLEQLHQLQAQSDQLLLTLDANQRAIFEALQRNLQSYQESLSQGLEKMHSLGTQGEMLFTTLVNRLAQQLGREASTILQSSLQVSDSARQTDELATTPKTPETLLPSVALTPPPNPSRGTPTPLQPLPPVEQLPTEPENAIAFFAPQGATPTESESSLEDISLEHLNCHDWEIVEGLDLENAGIELDNNDEVDTFIQLDIDSLESLPSVEEINPQSPSTSEDLDSFFGLVNEQLPTNTSSAAQTGWGEGARLDELDEAAELKWSPESRRQEINDLYESLFGTDSLTGTAKPDESDASEPTDASTSYQMSRDEAFVQENQSEPTAGETNAILFDQALQTSSLEDVLFEGFTDPATEPPLSPLPSWSAEQLPASWEDLFFEDSVAHSSTEGDFAEEAQTSSLANNSLSNQESPTEQESIKTITALTDLFEEMGLSYSPPIAKADSILVLTQQPLESQPPDTESQTSLVEDNYIPASPEEDLLATDGLESEPDIEIWLNQNTLQQLSEDLYSFEESESQDFQRQQQQRLPDNYFASPPVAPDAAPVNQQNQSFSMPDELLAEDWEEFRFNNWSDKDSRFQSSTDSATDFAAQEPDQFDSYEQEATLTSTNNEILGNSTAAVPESVESDFEPDLFPSEALELDQEQAQRINAAAPEELAIPEEVIAFEDEAFIEMQWDEPADSTSEEIISSLESEFDSDLLSEEPLDSELEEAVNAAMPGESIAPDDAAWSEDRWDEPSQNRQNTTLPPETSTTEWDSSLEETINSQPEELVDEVMPEEPITPNEAAWNEEGWDKSSENTQNTTLPPETLADESDSSLEETLGSQPEEAVNEAIPGEPIAPEDTPLTEDEPSDSLTKEAQPLDKSKALNPEQPDNQKKKNSESDSEANQ